MGPHTRATLDVAQTGAPCPGADDHAGVALAALLRTSRRRRTVWELLALIAERVDDRGTLETSLDDLAGPLELSAAAVSKTLQRLAHDGIELRIPHGHGADGRPIYAMPGAPMRLFLPSAARAAALERVRDRPPNKAGHKGGHNGIPAGQTRPDTRASYPHSAGQTRADSSIRKAGHKAGHNGIRAGQTRPDTTAGPRGSTPTEYPTRTRARRLLESLASSVEPSATATPLATGGFVQYHDTARGRVERFRCDRCVLVLQPWQRGPKCRPCQRVRERHQGTTQRPLVGVVDGAIASTPAAAAAPVRAARGRAPVRAVPGPPPVADVVLAAPELDAAALERRDAARAEARRVADECASRRRVAQ